jgi:hypothetical protein
MAANKIAPASVGGRHRRFEKSLTAISTPLAGHKCLNKRMNTATDYLSPLQAYCCLAGKEQSSAVQNIAAISKTY